MTKEPVSRIYKTHPQITADVESDDTGVEIGCLAAFLKEVLSSNEEDLKTIARWIKSKKRYLNKKANLLAISDENRKVILDEVEQLETLRQQLLTIFLGQQSLYQSLMTAEQELLKKYGQDSENGNTAVPSPKGVPSEARKQTKSRKPHRR